jgi:N4-gp56 family major capsid protein
MATDAYNVTGTDAYTQQTTLDFSKAAYDRLAYFALRPELYFDAAADVQPTAQSMPGASVTFTIVNDLSIASSALTEANDVAVVALSDSQVTLTLAEYGNAVLTTAKLRGTSFVDIDPVVANVVGYNAGVSIDTIARAALDSGTNVQYASGLGSTTLQSSITTRAGLVQQGAVGTGNGISSLDIRVARARLRSQNVPTFGGMYVGYIHPDLVADLQGETITGSNIQGWRAPHVYAQPGEIWTGELGAFEGVRWIETPRAPVYSGAGASSANVYGTIILGRQSLAKAYSMIDGNGAYPHVVPGPITDRLRRYVPLGWYWLGAYGIFRQASVLRIESTSLLGSDIGGTYDPTIDMGESTASTTSLSSVAFGSPSTGFATFTMAAANAAITTDSTVVISGATTGTINGTYVVTAVNTNLNTFTVASSLTTGTLGSASVTVQAA